MEFFTARFNFGTDYLCGGDLLAQHTAAGLEVKGPAIFESATTTVLVRESERVTVTPHGWLDIRLG